VTWRWLSRRAVLAIHAEQLTEHGGAPGIRDEELLDSALARPRQRAACAEPDAADLVASYGFGIVGHHPFVAGHRRTGFVAEAAFLLLNARAFEAAEAEVVTTFEQLAAGELTEQRLVEWFRVNSDQS
jgi:death-on-curing protein